MAPIRVVFRASLICLAGFSYNMAYAQDLGLPSELRTDACRIRYTAPAIVETVTNQVLVKPETIGIDPQTGQSIVTSPATYRTETEQRIVRARHENWAEIICTKDQSVTFIQSLQRALAARGYYRGVVTGVMDEQTKRALRKVQKSRGINTSEITLDLAESYGLVIHRIFKK